MNVKHNAGKMKPFVIDILIIQRSQMRPRMNGIWKKKDDYRA